MYVAEGRERPVRSSGERWILTTARTQRRGHARYRCNHRPRALRAGAGHGVRAEPDVHDLRGLRHLRGLLHGPASAVGLAPSAGDLGVIFTAGTIGMAAATLPSARLPIHRATCAGHRRDGRNRRRLAAERDCRGAGEFLTWRIVVGLALGVALPNIVSVAAEMMPARRRSLVIVVLYSGFAIGSALAGCGLAADANLRLGIGAGGRRRAPLALALAMLAELPESPRFIALRARRTLASWPAERLAAPAPCRPARRLRCAANTFAASPSATCSAKAARAAPC